MQMWSGLPAQAQTESEWERKVMETITIERMGWSEPAKDRKLRPQFTATGKTLPGLMNIKFFCDIWIVRSKFGRNNMETSKNSKWMITNKTTNCKLNSMVNNKLYEKTG